MEKTPESIIVEVDKVVDPAQKQIEITFLSSRKKELTLSTDCPLEVGHKPIQAIFPQTVLLNTLKFSVADNSNGVIFVDIFDSNSETTTTHKIQISNGIGTSENIGVLTNSIWLKTERGIIRNYKERVIKAEAFGFLKEEIEQLYIAYDQLSSLKQDCGTLVAKAQAENKSLVAKQVETKALLEQLGVEIKGKETERDELDEEIKDKTDELAALKQSVSEESSLLKQNQDKLKDVNSQIQDGEAKLALKVGEIQAKNQELGSLNAELQRLYSDKSLFTENLAGYSKQCDRDTQYYAVLIAVPIVLVVGLCGYLLYGSSGLQETLSLFPNRSSWDLLLIRAPQVTVVVLVLGVFGAFVRPFIHEIRTIKARRRRIAEISASIQDVVSSATKMHGLSEEEQLKLLVSQKMGILREFFSGRLERSDAQTEVVERTVIPLKDVAADKKQLKTKEPQQLDH